MFPYSSAQGTFFGAPQFYQQVPQQCAMIQNPIYALRQDYVAQPQMFFSQFDGQQRLAYRAAPIVAVPMDRSVSIAAYPLPSRSQLEIKKRRKEVLHSSAKSHDTNAKETAAPAKAVVIPRSTKNHVESDGTDPTVKRTLEFFDRKSANDREELKIYSSKELPGCFNILMRGNLPGISFEKADNGKRI